jgi:hypothetical protein
MRGAARGTPGNHIFVVDPRVLSLALITCDSAHLSALERFRKDGASSLTAIVNALADKPLAKRDSYGCTYELAGKAMSLAEATNVKFEASKHANLRKGIVDFVRDSIPTTVSGQTGNFMIHYLVASSGPQILHALNRLDMEAAREIFLKESLEEKVVTAASIALIHGTNAVVIWGLRDAPKKIARGARSGAWRKASRTFSRALDLTIAQLTSSTHDDVPAPDWTDDQRSAIDVELAGVGPEEFMPRLARNLTDEAHAEGLALDVVRQAFADFGDRALRDAILADDSGEVPSK